MTFGQAALGLGVFLTLLQLYLVGKTISANGISRSMLYIMLGMALLPPIMAYIAFYMIWPELGAKPFSG